MTRRLTTSLAVATTTLTVLSGLVVTSADAAERPRRTTTSAAFTATTAVLGSPVGVSGVVQDRAKGRRVVVLQQRTASGWRKVDRARTASDGTYALAVPTDWFYSSKMRVLAPRTRRAPADASRATRVTVVPAYVPTGSPDAWSPIRKRPTYRVNPCQTVTYRINAAQGLPDPASAVSASHNALAAVSQATGVRFRYVGDTATVPGGKGRWPRRTDLVIAWAKPSETTWRIGGGTAARGGAAASRWARDARGRRIAEMYRSAVVVDSTNPYVDVTNATQLLQHELGHVMGLGHVSAAGEHMDDDGGGYDVPALQWGAGDLTGFRKVGLMAGCIR